MTNSTLAVIFISCAFTVGCNKADEKTESKPPPANLPANLRPAEPAAKPAEPTPIASGDVTDLASYGLAMKVTLPAGAKVKPEGEGAIRVAIGGEPVLGIAKEANAMDRADSEADFRKAKTLTIVKSEDLPNGWLITVARKPKGFDVNRFRSDLGVLCEQRMLPDEATLATSIAICDSLTAK
jgi:hypothetical protein